MDPGIPLFPVFMPHGFRIIMSRHGRRHGCLGKREAFMHRLFVAIDLPGEVKNAVDGIVNRDLPGARRVPREQLHLTLRFIGDADEPVFQAIKKELATVRGIPFSLTIKGVGHFPPKREPRVLWVGMEGSGQLHDLQQRIEKSLSNAGIAADERRFSPHITIARLRDTPLQNVSSLEERHRGFTAGPFLVGEFYLYSSNLTREGAIHRREAEYRLEPATR
jgi:RNA 2',3'-cyclic 3'-phosphodiesterase